MNATINQDVYEKGQTHVSGLTVGATYELRSNPKAPSARIDYIKTNHAEYTLVASDGVGIGGGRLHVEDFKLKFNA
jgi:hypothetical protein